MFETVDALTLDTGGSAETLRVVAHDRLGNVATLGAPVTAILRAGSGLATQSPDTDADVTQEIVPVVDTRGALVQLAGVGALSIELVPEPGSTACAITALAMIALLRKWRNPLRIGSVFRSRVPFQYR